MDKNAVTIVFEKGERPVVKLRSLEHINVQRIRDAMKEFERQFFALIEVNNVDRQRARIEELKRRREERKDPLDIELERSNLALQNLEETILEMSNA